MNREDKLWSELSKEEKAEEKREFLESFALECGGKPEDYRMQWEQYLNQEGWTAHDEHVMRKRDQEYQDKKFTAWAGSSSPAWDEE